MMGKNHLITGAAATTAMVSLIITMGDGQNYTVRHADGLVNAVTDWWGLEHAEMLTRIGESVSHWVMPFGAVDTPVGFLYLLLGVALAMLGSLGPDIDSRNSWVGRRWPGAVWRFVMPDDTPHRGWSHSVWLQLVLFLIALPEPSRVLLFFWFGWSTHCFMDSLSKAGRVVLYPMGRYRVVTLSGGTRCVVQAKSRRGLYKTGHRSETVVAWVVVFIYGLLTSLIWVLY